MVLNKKGQRGGNTIFIVLLIAVAAIGLGLVDIGNLGGFFGGTAGGDGTPAPVTTGQCLTTDKNTITFDEVDKFNPGETVDKGGRDEIFHILGNGIGALRPGTAETDGDDDGGTRTFAPTLADDQVTRLAGAQPIDIYFGLDPTGTAGTNANGTYYTTLVTDVDITCKGADTITAEVVNQTDLTFRLFSEDDQLILTETRTNTEDVDDGDTDCLDGIIKSADDLGMPYGGCMIVDFAKNATTLSDVTMRFNGVEAESCPVPDAHDETYYDGWISSQIADADRTTKGFKMPATEDALRLDWTVCLEDNSGGTFGGGDGTPVNFTVWDFDYVYSDKDKGVILASEDPDNDVDVGRPNAHTAYIGGLSTGIVLATS